MTARTVDFGASDAPLNPTQRAECGGCVQIPWALAATLVSYNVPGVSGRLRLTGPVLAQIYFGKITRWDDPAIARLNRGLALPAAKIAPVYRLDGSGDTYVFTDYLSRVSPAWRSKVGTGVSVTWPAGTGARGNAGVAAVVSTTLGAIGYLAIAQVRHSGLRYAVLRNRAGRYPDPMPATIAAAAATGRLGPSNGVSLVDAAGANAYPLSTFTYVIVRKGSSKLPALKKLIAYAVSPRGQELGRRLSFAPLPASVRAADLRALRRF
jgi:phosphate transport system substrate-binding protein